MNQQEATKQVAEALKISGYWGYDLLDVSVVRAIADPSCPQSDVILVELTTDGVLSVTVEILAQP